MTRSTPALRAILVTGDTVCDCFTYRAATDAPGSAILRGTRMFETLGGANLSCTILESIASMRAGAPAFANSAFQVQFGYDRDRFSPRKVPQSLWTFALCSAAPSAGDTKVWRVTDVLGYGSDRSTAGVPVPPHLPGASIETPAVVVVDDGNLGFRKKSSDPLWPACIKDHAAAAESPWVILKSIHPICSSDLWRAIISSNVPRSRSIVVTSIDDLRRGEIHVSSGISWERSASDIVSELASNPMLQPLTKVGYVVISLGAAGAFLADYSDNEPRFRLIFDPANLEGDIEARISGQVFGRMSCMAAAIAAHLVDAPSAAPPELVVQRLERGIEAGIRGLRKLHQVGYGPADSSTTPGFPFEQIAGAIEASDPSFSAANVPAKPDPDWAILRASASGASTEPRPMTATAMSVALRGLPALRGVPYQQYGEVTTVDRGEIEDLRALNRLVDDYAAKPPDSKPLCVAVFGAPGSGKSFLVKQLIEASNKPDIEPMEFNLSQFTNPDELRGPLHQVRDLVLAGKLPLVFWDEFDSQEYRWLQHFLMPMQDGTFQEGQVTHPIGKCIFVFAGGTSRQYERFGDRVTPEEFDSKKGPDFLSRLHGYLNVIGPNTREIFDTGKRIWVRDESDVCSHLRRALLLRSVLKLKRNARLEIDRGLLRAFLEISAYRYGARSMKQLIQGVRRSSRTGSLRRSDLPPRAIMSLMVDPEEFFRIMTKDDAFKREAELMAPSIHDFYRDLARKQGWKVTFDMDYAALPDNIKDDNIAAAMRIPEVLSLVQLRVVPINDSAPVLPEGEVSAIIEKHIDLLAEAEHNGWMDYKLLNDWTFGPSRDDEKRIHPALVPYAQLTEKDKEKDRNSVRQYPHIVSRAKHRISR